MDGGDARSVSGMAKFWVRKRLVRHICEFAESVFQVGDALLVILDGLAQSADFLQEVLEGGGLGGEQGRRRRERGKERRKTEEERKKRRRKKEEENEKEESRKKKGEKKEEK